MNIRSFFRLRLPQFQGEEARLGLRVVRGVSGASVDATGFVCPKCGKGRLVATKTEPDRRICTTEGCGFTVDLSELADYVRPYLTPELEQARLKEASQLFYFGCFLVLATAAWGVFNDSLLTLVGGVVASLGIFILSVVARYRAWQLQTKRVFEPRAPFGDFLRDMLRFGGRHASEDEKGNAVQKTKSE